MEQQVEQSELLIPTIGPNWKLNPWRIKSIRDQVRVTPNPFPLSLTSATFFAGFDERLLCFRFVFGNCSFLFNATLSWLLVCLALEDFYSVLAVSIY
jgi:hypothetical protein